MSNIEADRDGRQFHYRFIFRNVKIVLAGAAREQRKHTTICHPGNLARREAR